MYWNAINVEAFTAARAHCRKNLLNNIYLIHRYKIPLLALMSRLTSCLRFLDFFAGLALGLAVGPSDDGGLEELEESRRKRAILRSSSSIRALNCKSTSTMTSGACGLWLWLLPSSWRRAKPHSLHPSQWKTEKMSDIARLETIRKKAKVKIYPTLGGSR